MMVSKIQKNLCKDPLDKITNLSFVETSDIEEWELKLV